MLSRKASRKSKKDPASMDSGQDSAVSAAEETSEAFALKVQENACISQSLQRVADARLAVLDRSAAINPDKQIGIPDFLREKVVDLPEDPLAFSYRITPAVVAALPAHKAAVKHSICGGWSHTKDKPVGLHFLRFRPPEGKELVAADYENLDNYFCIFDIDPPNGVLEERSARELRLGGMPGNEKVKLSGIKLNHSRDDRRRCERNYAYEVNLTFTSLKQGAKQEWAVNKSVFPANMNANDVMGEMLGLPGAIPLENKNYSMVEAGPENHGGVPGSCYPNINKTK